MVYVGPVSFQNKTFNPVALSQNVFWHGNTIKLTKKHYCLSLKKQQHFLSFENIEQSGNISFCLYFIEKFIYFGLPSKVHDIEDNLLCSCVCLCVVGVGQL